MRLSGRELVSYSGLTEGGAPRIHEGYFEPNICKATQVESKNTELYVSIVLKLNVASNDCLLHSMER